MKRDWMFGAVFGAIVGGAAFRMLPVLAAGDPSSDNLPRAIAYDGTLSYEGEALTGSYDMRFTIYDRDDFALWSEENNGVSVTDGKFSVLLGDDEALTATALQGGTALLGIELKIDGTWQPMDGRQRLAATPRAMWAAAAPDLNVDGSLTVGGAVVLTGTDYVEIDGDLILQKTSAKLSIGSSGGPHGLIFADPGEDGAQLLFRTSPNTFVLENKNDGSDATDVFKVAESDGSLTTTDYGDFDSTLAVNGGDMTVSPSSDSTGLTLKGGDILMGVDSATWKGIAFSDNDTTDSTKGMQFSYNQTSNGLALEGKANLTNNAADLWYIDDGGQMYVSGNFEVGGMVLQDRTFTAGTGIENAGSSGNSADKVYFADSSCKSGAIGQGIDSNGQANICVCMNGEKDQGWYCWN